MHFRVTKIFLFIQVILLCSCVTSRSTNHFAKTKNAEIKRAANINFFGGKIEIQNYLNGKEEQKFYLLYKNDSLKYISLDKRIPNNDYIYKIKQKADSNIMLTRATMSVRYFVTDTIIFKKDIAIHKKCLFDYDRVVQFNFKEFFFSKDSLTINFYKSENDLLSTFNYKKGKMDTRNLSYSQNFRNYSKLTFFRSFIR